MNNRAKPENLADHGGEAADKRPSPPPFLLDSAKIRGMVCSSDEQDGGKHVD